ncbi:endoglucanase [Pseudonocardiaceae bacterium YIM PH 21723]|nr:endoglucanase [Pseudonocardiaceae bacterium YIM PH 21723]
MPAARGKLTAKQPNETLNEEPSCPRPRRGHFAFPAAERGAAVGNPYPLVTKGLYLDNQRPVDTWLTNNPRHPSAPAVRASIAAVPQARWSGGGDVTQWIKDYVSAASAAKQLPVITQYALPERDLGGYAAGGAAGFAEYQQDVEILARAIGSAPAALILEPDGLIHLPGLAPLGQVERYSLLCYAIARFARLCPQTATYLDVGEAPDQDPATIALALVRAGVASARGFAINTSNFSNLETCNAYATVIRQLLQARYGVLGVRYVVDTSRNGAGRPSPAYIAAHPSDWWCNPVGARLGQRPRIIIDATTGCDALLWIKAPGVSDGPTGVVPGIDNGIFDPRLAVALINGR